MSSKFVFGVLLPAILIMGLVIVFKEHVVRTPRRNVPAVAAPAPAPKLAINDNPRSLPLPAVPALVPAPAVARTMTPDEIQVEKSRLVSWEMNNDPQSLSNIMADLSSPIKEIRMAAIQAAVQFDSPKAIPGLKAAAASDPNPDEQTALLDAADFLSTPPMTFGSNSKGPTMTPAQLQAEQQEEAQDKAARQALIQQRQGQSQNSSGTTSPQTSSQ
jgi:hypothetical protein